MWPRRRLDPSVATFSIFSVAFVYAKSPYESYPY